MQSLNITFTFLPQMLISMRKILLINTLTSIKQPLKLCNRCIFAFSWPSWVYFYQLINTNIKCNNNVDTLVKQYSKRRQQMRFQSIIDSKKSILSTIWSILSHTFRFIQLFLIFFPVILLYPFRNIQCIRNIWLSILVWSVQKAGVVWIKAFQYMSHRRDIIGPDMADKFVHLRQHAPVHKLEQTKKNIYKNFGKNIQDIFQQFNSQPIASGSISQVYKAMYHKKIVGVKVRHPSIQKYIQRDINLLFFISRTLSLFSRRFYLPTTQLSLKQTLIDQIDFINEKNNLLIFNQMFKTSNLVKFPHPLSQSTSSILIQNFIQGLPITYFQTHPHQLNPEIARIGVYTFFQMLMKNNFIHADCHGGNILIKIQEKSQQASFSFKFQEFITQQYQKITNFFTFYSLQSDIQKQLFTQSKNQQKKIHQIVKNSKYKVQVTLIDAGMAIQLTQNDRQNFTNFIKSVLHSNGQNCAQMIFNLSMYDGKTITKTKFPKFFSQLRHLFSQLDGQPLSKLRGLQLLVGMLNIIRQNNMKLQGQFATLLTNILILQSIAKKLNPQINILKCAIPYFKYVNPGIKPILENQTLGQNK